MRIVAIDPEAWPAAILDELSTECGPCLLLAASPSSDLMARAKNEMAPFAVYPGPCASIGVSAAQALMDLPRLNAIVCDLLPDEIEREHPHLWSIVREKYFFIPSNFASEPSIASQKAHFHHPASASTAETGHFTATLLAEALNETTCSARAETATIHDPVSVLAIEGAQNLAAFLQRSENSRSRAVNLAETSLLRQLIDDVDGLARHERPSLKRMAQRTLDSAHRGPRRLTQPAHWLAGLACAITNNASDLLDHESSRWASLAETARSCDRISPAGLALAAAARSSLPKLRPSELELIAEALLRNPAAIDLVDCQDIQTREPSFASVCALAGERIGGSAAHYAANLLFRGVANSSLTSAGYMWARQALELLSRSSVLPSPFLGLRLSLELGLGRVCDLSQWSLLDATEQTGALWESFKAWLPILETTGSAGLHSRQREQFVELRDRMGEHAIQSERLAALLVVSELHLAGPEKASSAYFASNLVKQALPARTAAIALLAAVAGYFTFARSIWKNVDRTTEASNPSDRFLVAAAESIVGAGKAAEQELREAFADPRLAKRQAPASSTVFYYALALRRFNHDAEARRYLSMALLFDPLAEHRQKQFENPELLSDDSF